MGQSFPKLSLNLDELIINSSVSDLGFTGEDLKHNWTLTRMFVYWSALATAPAETSAEAKEASIINKIFSFSF